MSHFDEAVAPPFGWAATEEDDNGELLELGCETDDLLRCQRKGKRRERTVKRMKARVTRRTILGVLLCIVDGLFPPGEESFNLSCPY